MAVAVKDKKKKTGVKRRGHMPTKRVINLATQGEKRLRVGIAIPAIILILAAAVVFSKFMVIDRLTEVSIEQGKVMAIQRELNSGYQELDDFDDLSILYAHYTYSGFTKEELNRTDRTAVLDVISRIVLPDAKVSSWSLTGNQLTINLSAETLQKINLLAQELEEDDLVDFCTVNTANTNASASRARIEKNAELSEVKARILVYLNSGTGVNAG